MRFARFAKVMILCSTVAIILGGGALTCTRRESVDNKPPDAGAVSDAGAWTDIDAGSAQLSITPVQSQVLQFAIRPSWWGVSGDDGGILLHWTTFDQVHFRYFVETLQRGTASDSNAAFERATAFGGSSELVNLAEGSSVSSAPLFNGFNPNRYPVPDWTWLDGGVVEITSCDYPSMHRGGASAVPNELWLALPTNCDSACGTAPAIELRNVNGDGGIICVSTGGEKPQLFALHPNARIASAPLLSSGLNWIEFDDHDGGAPTIFTSPSRSPRWMAFWPSGRRLVTVEAVGTGGKDQILETVAADGGLSTSISVLDDLFSRLSGFSRVLGSDYAIGYPPPDAGLSWRVAKFAPDGGLTISSVPWSSGNRPQLVAYGADVAAFTDATLTDGGFELRALLLP